MEREATNQDGKRSNQDMERWLAAMPDISSLDADELTALLHRAAAERAKGWTVRVERIPAAEAKLSSAHHVLYLLEPYREQELQRLADILWNSNSNLQPRELEARVAPLSFSKVAQFFSGLLNIWPAPVKRTISGPPDTIEEYMETIWAEVFRLQWERMFPALAYPSVAGLRRRA